jgi:hypothetical protein
MQRRAFLKTLLGGLAISSMGSLHAKAGTGARKILLLESPLAGYQYHRAEGVWTFLRVGESLRLVREPGNPHDPNAIAVYFKNDRLGYVPRNENRALALMLDHGERIQAHVTRLTEDADPWRRIRFTVELVV